MKRNAEKPTLIALVLRAITTAALAAAMLASAACDMTRIYPAASMPPGGELSDAERDALEKSGRYLKLTHMPENTQLSNISSVVIANSEFSIARLDKEGKAKIFKDSVSVAVYLPLACNDGSEFTETGSFFAAFSIHVDAVTSFTVDLPQKLLVPFTDGRGELDVRSIPVSGSDSSSLILSDFEREELEKSGRYLKLTHMPLNTQGANVVSVQIANSASSIAKLDKDEAVRIFNEAASSTVYLPLAYNDGSEFCETGYFYAAFSIHVDAVASFSLALEDKFLVSFTDGRGGLDVRTLPYKGPAAPDRRCLTIINLPPHLLPQNVSKVFVHNQAGPIAFCEDYELVDVSSFNASSSVSIPLTLAGSSNLSFSGTGSFYVSFDLFIDALSHYTVAAADRVLVSFVNGSGFLDIGNLPNSSDGGFLDIKNLPPNLIPQNVSKVNILNQSGSVAKCENYDLLEISSSGGKSTLRIPLSFNNPPSTFTGTGSFYVAFDIVIDALTHFKITAEDQVLVPFASGKGALDINSVPEKPVPCLKISGLPANTVKSHFSSIAVYNMSGTVASADYNKISVSATLSSAAAVIPLLANESGYFNGTGNFAVTFTVNVDRDTQISFTIDDNLTLQFANGSAHFDLSESFGAFSGELANPFDFDPPVIKRDSSFELDGVIRKVSEHYDKDVVIESLLPTSTTMLFIYAYTSGNDVFFEYSTVAPSYVQGKSGFYNGSKRALWKMLFIKEEGGNKFTAKAKIHEDFPAFEYHTVSNDNSAFPSESSPGFPLYYELSGENNPWLASISLPPGVYSVRLEGAGGGASYGARYNYFLGITLGSEGLGGNGGLVSEIIVVPQPSAFSFFTGSGGCSSPEPEAEGSFLAAAGSYSGNRIYGSNNSSSGSLPLTAARMEQFIHSFEAKSGSGGGGGGSGTFVFSSQLSYLLCAGGGGGGSGYSLLTPGGGGGAGGSAGPGAGGGAAGGLVQDVKRKSYNSSASAQDYSSMRTVSGPGGSGGGWGAGAGGSGYSYAGRLGGTPSTVIDDSNFWAVFSASSNGLGAEPYAMLDHGGDIVFGYTQVSGNQNGTWETNVFTISNGVFQTANECSPSGDGGPALFISDYISSIAWAKTNNANGKGADAPALHAFPEAANTGNFYSPKWEWDNLTKASGRNGGAGGNNRNASRGGGADGGAPGNEDNGSNGSPGYIAVYKIY